MKLVTDGAPTLALGVDPANAGVMTKAAAPARCKESFGGHTFLPKPFTAEKLLKKLAELLRNTEGE